jgi:hypothetical protein
MLVLILVLLAAPCALAALLLPERAVRRKALATLLWIVLILAALADLLVRPAAEHFLEHAHRRAVYRAQFLYLWCKARGYLR